jgi:hypothetical protein
MAAYPHLTPISTYRSPPISERVLVGATASITGELLLDAVVGALIGYWLAPTRAAQVGYLAAGAGLASLGGVLGIGLLVGYRALS